MEILSSIIARLSSYNILNYFIPGSAMYILLKFIVGVEWFCGMQWYELILVMYFLGMICNRVSSLIVEKRQQVSDKRILSPRICLSVFLYSFNILNASKRRVHHAFKACHLFFL